jgi:hypothetical protein
MAPFEALWPMASPEALGDRHGAGADAGSP